ncbi:SMI1/KNR4 family protein [Nonomuraea dietziae]|uniref:SMI1/KNR4 family protein n=1 Tax=Nonomuraea dietziae TaxID=65515 RepID=UPI00343B81D7
MVKLVRLVLTAAILAAIAVRLRRRRTGVTRERRAEAPSRRRPWPRRWVSVGVALAVLAASSLALDAWVFAKPPQPPQQPDRWTLESDIVGRDLMPDWTVSLYGCSDGNGSCKTAVAIARESEQSAPGRTPRTAEPTRENPEPSRLLFEEMGERPAETPLDVSCHPVRRAPAVRSVDPGVRRAVNRQWRRIEGWLAANAPKSRSRLGRPARAGTIAVAEAQMGLRFPDDLRASLLRHNGGFSLPGHDASGVRSIQYTWRYLCRDDHDNGGGPREESWDGQMIPVGPDGSGGYLVMDSERGDLGETLEADSMYFTGEPWARSFHALLKATADALESGEPVDGHRPRAISGELVWEYVG